MGSPSRTAPGLGTWLIAALSLLLVLAAAIARADDAPADHEADTDTHGVTDTVADDDTDADPVTDADTDADTDTVTDTDTDDDTDAVADTVTVTVTDTVTDTDTDDDTDEDPGAHDDTDEDPVAHDDTDEDPGAHDDTDSDTDTECLRSPVLIVRVHGRSREGQRLALTRCDGRPNRDALDPLSVLARPHGVDRPTSKDPPNGKHVAPRIRRLHPGLLSRLQALADRWPGRRIEIVSGYRPGARRTSRHHHGRALDLRVAGVSREDVSDFARTLDRTGVGYYPNSVFTHIDVRHREAFWVDRSAPGEAPDYGPWPPEGDERERIRDRVLANAFEALERLATHP
jgi:hypothetical protein